MNIGIELEFTGVARKTVAKALCQKWHTDFHIKEFLYGTEVRTKYCVKDRRGQEWGIVLDKSISPSTVNSISLLNREEYMCELVSPVIDSKDLSVLYEAMSIIRIIGGIVNETCGVHIHVDCDKYVEIVKAWFSLFFGMQYHIIDEFGIPENRIDNYCNIYPTAFIKRLQQTYPSIQSVPEFVKIFHDELGNNMSPDDPKNAARYYMINADSIYKQNTIEFRFFNSTLSMRTMRDYVSWVQEYSVRAGRYQISA